MLNQAVFSLDRLTFAVNEEKGSHNKCFDGIGSIAGDTIPVVRRHGSLEKAVFRKTLPPRLQSSQNRSRSLA